MGQCSLQVRAVVNTYEVCNLLRSGVTVNFRKVILLHTVHKRVHKITGSLVRLYIRLSVKTLRFWESIRGNYTLECRCSLEYNTPSIA